MTACGTCGYCPECETMECNCCETCERSQDDCECRYCEECDDSVDSSDFCEDHERCESCCLDLHQDEDGNTIDNDYLDTALAVETEPSEQLRLIELEVEKWLIGHRGFRWSQAFGPNPSRCSFNIRHHGKECLNPGNDRGRYRPDMIDVIHHQQKLADGTMYERTFCSLARDEAFGLSCRLHRLHTINELTTKEKKAS